MVAVAAGRGQQREHEIVSLPGQQIGQSLAIDAQSQVCHGASAQSPFEAGIGLFQEVVAPDAQHAARVEGFLPSNRGQVGPAVRLSCYGNAIDRFGQARVPVAALTVVITT